MKSNISMKKHTSLILTGLLIAAVVCAQNPETITNSSVIKMSKANLSDELIIDLINHSQVKFDLTPGAIRNLEGEGVSEAVIQVMKSPSPGMPEADPPVSVKDKPNPVQSVSLVEETTETKAWEPSRTLEEVSVKALNYTVPLTELIKFYANKFENMELTTSEWDRQVRGYINDISKDKAQMLQVENEMRTLKNADTKAFSEEIITLKGKLAAYRKNYRQSKDIMIKGGENIAKQIESLSGEVTKDISKAYSEASQQVTSSDLDPSSGENPVILDYTVKEAGAGCVSYLVYLNEMMAWYQNEIREINSLIEEWNPRVAGLIREDAQLGEQAEPLEKRIIELGSNARQNKSEISDLKKQIAGIEKSRKQLADRMKDDARELSSYIKKMSQNSQDAVEERFADIVENVTYSFGEKLSL